MKNVKGNLYFMKEINRSMILSLLHREKALSRAKIAQMTKLSATTISSLVDELIMEGYIVESGESASTGAGRKAITLEISRDKGYCISVFLHDEKTFLCTLTNFHCEIVEQLTVPAATGNDGVLKAILDCIEQMVPRTGVNDFSNIKGICVVSPGVVDNDNGTIVYSSSLKLDKLDITRLLRARYNLPIYVMNNTKAAAFAEYYLGNKSEVKNLLYLWIFDGVGAGLIVNGQIVSGYLGVAGEVTFLNEQYYESTYVLEQGRKLAADHGAVIPLDNIEDIVQAYESGEVWLEPLMFEVLQKLSQSVACMMNLLGSEQVVLDGWFTRSSKCMNRIHSNLSQFTIYKPYDPNRVTAASLGRNNYILGAATMMLHHLFKEKVTLT